MAHASLGSAVEPRTVSEPAAAHSRPPSDVPPGQARTDRFMRYTLSAIRALNCTLCLVVLITRFEHYRTPALALAMFVLAIGWSIWLFGFTTRGGMVTKQLLWADVAITLCALVVVGLECEAVSATDWTNWSFAYALAVVLTTAAVLRWPAVLSVAALFGITYLAAVAPALRRGEASLANGVGNVVSFFGFALFGLVLAGHLRRTGEELDLAIDRALIAEAERSRIADRITQYRTLHDTVLATLTAIARGGLDHRSDSVRARCARQADYLRQLIEGEVVQLDHPLAVALSEVIERSSDSGLRVHVRLEDLSATLPPATVRAFAGATEEALENVLRHSGATRAHVTILTDSDVTVVRVVDQGRGFDPNTLTRGFGLAESIEGRMRDSGGTSTVTSHPGEGTWVELTWPAP
jgi:signal transduction histidine kinase